MMSARLSFILVLICLASAVAARSQQLVAPEPQTGHISGTVTDVNGDIVPGATVILHSTVQPDHQTLLANDNAFFEFDNVKAGAPYQLTITANGFADWQSEIMTLMPGQFQLVPDIQLKIAPNSVSVTVTASRTELAIQQVKLEEQQRVLGFIPNFYVEYNHNAAPLTPKLKFELALKVSIDPVTFAGTSFLAGLNQAARYPNYAEGAKGYGQRFGAIYANDLTDIMIGGAILPSILHQDPRYFYQGTGTTKSRLLHALTSPVICKGDNGRWQPNFSSIGGYVASGAIANAYYPPANRGGRLVLNTFLVDFSANEANGVIQEFILRKLTSSIKNRN